MLCHRQNYSDRRSSIFFSQYKNVAKRTFYEKSNTIELISASIITFLSDLLYFPIAYFLDYNTVRIYLFIFISRSFLILKNLKEDPKCTKDLIPKSQHRRRPNLDHYEQQKETQIKE